MKNKGYVKELLGNNQLGHLLVTVAERSHHIILILMVVEVVVPHGAALNESLSWLMLL